MPKKSTIRKSPWISLFNSGGCNGCAIECLTLISPKYDIERFGCLLKGSARHADILLVTGAMTEQSRERLETVYSQMAKTKYVIAMGACACSGGVFRTGYNIKKSIDKVIPVDMYLPGCPPRPEAIIDAVLKSISKK